MLNVTVCSLLSVSLTSRLITLSDAAGETYTRQSSSLCLKLWVDWIFPVCVFSALSVFSLATEKRYFALNGSSHTASPSPLCTFMSKVMLYCEIDSWPANSTKAFFIFLLCFLSVFSSVVFASILSMVALLKNVLDTIFCFSPLSAEEALCLWLSKSPMILEVRNRSNRDNKERNLTTFSLRLSL